MDYGYVIVRDFAGNPDAPPAVLIETGFESPEEALERVNAIGEALGPEHAFVPVPDCVCGCCFMNGKGDAVMTIGTPAQLIAALQEDLDLRGRIISGNRVADQLMSQHAWFHHGPQNN